jgi:PST family polysaccharide transporter
VDALGAAVTMSEPRDQDETASKGLRDAAVSGVRWVALGSVTADAVQFGAAIVLARTISPAEFGHAAIALILVPLASILTFEGFGSALVQRKEISDRHVRAAMLASLAAGALLTALAGLGAPVAAAPIFGERTAELIQLASPLFVIAGVSAVARSMLWRELRFRDASLIQMASLLIGAVSSVALALAGLSGEAIVLGALIGQVVATALFLLAVPPVAPRWHRAELRDILGFGGPASAAGLLHVAITNVDYTILAARLSAAQTGFYWRAFQLGVVYQDKISGVFMRLAFPVYSRTKDLAELGALHERASRVHAAAVVPLLAVLIVTAPDLVPWLFGARWEPAVLPAQILAVAGMIAAILTGFAQVMLAAGRPQALMRFNIAVLIVYAGVVWVAASGGIVTVSIAVVGVYVGMLAVVYGVLFRRVLGMPVRRMVADLGPAVVGSSALLAVGFPLAELLRSLDVYAPAIAAAVGVVGLSTHALVLRTLFSAVWSDLTGLTRRVLPARLARRRPTQPLPQPQLET